MVNKQKHIVKKTIKNSNKAILQSLWSSECRIILKRIFPFFTAVHKRFLLNFSLLFANLTDSSPSLSEFFVWLDLTSRCKQLEHLDVSGCGLVSGVGVTTSHLSPHLPLQFLDMSDCSRLDDTSLRLVVESCPQLQFLYLRRCTQISGQCDKFLTLQQRDNCFGL